MKKNFRFFDNRQKYLLFVTTTNEKNKIDPKITEKIWKNMIMAYIDFERRNFKKK